MLRDKTVISHIGLIQREVAVIRSLFALLPALQESYEIADSERAAEADVVFVNADLPAARARWAALAARGAGGAPVMVCAGGSSGTQRMIRRPLVLKKLVAMLESITSAEVGAPQQQDPVPRSAAHVLVVDDSYPVRKFLERKLAMLAPATLRVDFADCAEQAQLRFAATAYSLAFVDVVMPGMDGYRLCKWIKARHPTRVVMLTSRKSAFDKVRGAMAGCDTYLVKPPAEEALRAVLEGCLPAPPAPGIAPGGRVPHGAALAR